MDDFAISPVDGEPLEGLRPLPATPAVQRTDRVAAPVTVPTSSAGGAHEEGLGAATERTQLAANAAVEPRDVEVRATVHDAAAHGSSIAAAIERAERTARAEEVERQARRPSAEDIDPNAQMLGGAAASAYSGQSAVIRRDARTFDPADVASPTASDPIAPVDSGSDDDQRGRRNRQAQEALRRNTDVNLDLEGGGAGYIA
ncbi:MAG: hypothetical protein H7287_02835 [Thermoleophilia bacterium]|nr:hypothetical protein [Thermoleophilia bacterium]